MADLDDFFAKKDKKKPKGKKFTTTEEVAKKLVETGKLVTEKPKLKEKSTNNPEDEGSENPQIEVIFHQNINLFIYFPLLFYLLSCLICHFSVIYLSDYFISFLFRLLRQTQGVILGYDERTLPCLIYFYCKNVTIIYFFFLFLFLFFND